MADPTGVSIAFADDAFDTTPTWTRLDGGTYNIVNGWSIDRGRSTELDKTQTGTATINTIDTQGRLDPTNTGGPFYGNLDPMKQATISLYNPVTTTWSRLFTGFTSELEGDFDVSANFLTTTLSLADAFDVLASLEMHPGEHGDTPTAPVDFADVYFKGTPSGLTGQANVSRHVDRRINDLLDAASWPDSLRDIFSGNVTVRGKVYERRDSLMSALQDAADAEFPGVGNIFVDRTGKFRFRGRFARFYPGRVGYGISNWLCGTAGEAALDSAMVPIAGLSFRRSEIDVYNAVLATWLNMPDSDIPNLLVKDDTSIGKYGYRGLSFDSLLTYQGHDDSDVTTDTPTEMGLFANYYLANYKDPKTRVSRISFRPVGVDHPNATALWALMCGIEIGDLITLETTHPGGGGFSEDFYVEGIHYDADVQGGAAFTNVTLEVDVSPRSFFDSNPFGSRDDTVSARLTGTGVLTGTGSAA